MKTLLVLSVVVVAVLCQGEEEAKSPFQTRKDVKLTLEYEVSKLAKRISQLEVQGKQGGSGGSAMLMKYTRQLAQRVSTLERYYNRLAKYSKNTDAKFEKAKKEFTEIMEKINEQLDEGRQFAKDVQVKGKEFGGYLQQHGDALKKAFVWLDSIQKQLNNLNSSKDDRKPKGQHGQHGQHGHHGKHGQHGPKRHHDKEEERRQPEEEEPEEIEINDPEEEPEEIETKEPAKEEKKKNSWMQKMMGNLSQKAQAAKKYAANKAQAAKKYAANKAQAAKNLAAKYWQKYKNNPMVQKYMNSKKQGKRDEKPKTKEMDEEPEEEEENNGEEFEEEETMIDDAME